MAAISGLMRVMERAARKAGGRLRRDFGEIEHLQVSKKGPADFVSKADQHAERTLWDELRTARPGWGFLMEEGGEIAGEPGKPRFIIDPLDGTTNFIHGFPVYCVSIALAVRGKIEQAVIYDPSRNDLFTATKGRGAYLNERRIRVSKRTRLGESLISTGFPFRPGDNFKAYLAMMADIMPRTAGLRRPGAAALDLAYVAAGFCDGFFETGLSIWDIAAGSLLVTEAGGLVGNFTGEADFLEQKECLAGNPRIYGQLVTILGKYSKFAGAGEKAAVRQALGQDAASSESTDADVGETPTEDAPPAAAQGDAPF